MGKMRFRRQRILASAAVTTVAAAMWPLGAIGQTTQDIRIVTYNTQDDVGTGGDSGPTPAQALPNVATTLEGIGQQKYVGDSILRLPDIIALQETTSNSVTVVPLANELNTYYGSNIFSSSTYQATNYNGDDTHGNGPNGLVYNQNTLNLMASVGVGTPGGSGNGEYRQVVRYEFQPISDKGTSNGIFYVYDSHYKSGSAGSGSSSNGYYRNEEAQIVRNDEAANLPANAAVLYVGDYNLDGSTEAMYQTLTAVKSPSGVSQGQAFDPLNPTDNYNETWEYNTTYVGIMTESDTALEYRDDLETMTANVYTDAAGTLNYISGSYHAFGNNGTTLEDHNIDSPSTNTSLNDIVGNGPLSPTTVFSAMQGNIGSDHLPVVADYSLALPSQTLTWNNAGVTLINDGMTWDVNHFLNWNNGSNSTTYTDGSAVTFNDANNGHYAVTLNSTVSPGSVIVNNSAGDYTISGTGSIAGAASLTKSGSRMLTLSTANTYSGGTTVNAGTLVVNNASGSATGSGSVTLNGGILASGTTGSISGNVLAGAASHTIAPGGVGTVGSLIIGGLISTNLTTLNFDLGTGTGTVTNGDLLTLGSGTVSIGSGTLMTFGGTAVAGDDYRLIGDTSSGAVVDAITLSNFTLPTAPSGLTFALSNTVDTGYIDLVVTPSGPVSLSWNNTGAGSPSDGVTWDTANSNWNNGTSATTYADGALVTFNDTNNSHYAVTLASTVSPGSVTVNNSLGNYTITGAGGKIADVGAFTKSGSGTLTLGTALSVGSMSITAGTLKLATGVSGGSGPAITSPIDLTSLSITGNGVLDVNNNHVIITYGASDPFSTIAGYIKSGYNGGGWNGPGIISSAALTPTNGLLYGLGYADGADGLVSGLASGQIEVAYTLLGDANLDGLVNAADFTILAANFNQPVTGWDQGDFNYDGLVNAADFTDLAANFNQSDSGAASSGDVAALDAFAAANGLLSAVPEPGSASLCVLLASAGLMRRMRRTNPRRTSSAGSFLAATAMGASQ
ncbi:MAG: autotransporter-associated beta strand repeat-containing protein [Tepidisphaeraceae bacterium]|jgi:autotransporter-associated beta strand protein